MRCSFFYKDHITYKDWCAKRNIGDNAGGFLTAPKPILATCLVIFQSSLYLPGEQARNLP